MYKIKKNQVILKTHSPGETATASIVVLPARLTMQKKRQGSSHSHIFLLRQTNGQSNYGYCPTDYLRFNNYELL